MPRPPFSLSLLVAGALLACVLRLVTLGAAADVVEIGSRLELFVDRYLIDMLAGAELRLHHPRPAGSALKFDRPWEDGAGYATVLHDAGTNRLYYRGSRTKDSADGSAAEVTCYAESVDGIRWTKPDLG